MRLCFGWDGDFFQKPKTVSGGGQGQKYGRQDRAQLSGLDSKYAQTVENGVGKYTGQKTSAGQE